MSLRDVLGIAVGNLRRVRLRSFLTVSGVVIAIGAFVAMLSFGAGNRRLVTQQFQELGLLFTMQVTPRAESDSTRVPLDDDAVRALGELPGVELAFPLDDLPVTVRLLGRESETTAQALPRAAFTTRLYSRLAAGEAPGEDGAGDAMVTEALLDELDIGDPDSVVGARLLLEMRVASADSGFAEAFAVDPDTLRDRLARVRLDSLSDQGYRRRLVFREINEATSRFMRGFMAGRTLHDTLTVRGVLEGGHQGQRLRVGPVIVPVATALRFHGAGLPPEPMALMRAAGGGDLFATEQAREGEFPQVTLQLDPRADHAAVADTVRALGLRAFSFAEQYDEIRRAFLFFDLGLAAVGLVALITAALGIVNTLVMSITERRREIGIFISLGADTRDIRLLFLVESAVIGLVGSIFGIALGWLVTRIASGVAKAIMTRQGLPPMEVFALPLWLILMAVGIGLGVSLVAGSYPAARAAKVDPVEALRGE
ncbi:MAG: ABC transporter permease [Candidatus Krumholzibacteriota bacterium]|nr:ABC transporter permease [Candidatus Krumholzibacteriota bacterium]